jgi:hypothetical protein
MTERQRVARIRMAERVLRNHSKTVDRPRSGVEPPSYNSRIVDNLNLRFMSGLPMIAPLRYDSNGPNRVARNTFVKRLKGPCLRQFTKEDPTGSALLEESKKSEATALLQSLDHSHNPLVLATHLRTRIWATAHPPTRHQLEGSLLAINLQWPRLVYLESITCAEHRIAYLSL